MDFKSQLALVEELFSGQRLWLLEILRKSFVESAVIDFGVTRDFETAATFFCFPPKILLGAGELGIFLELSVYFSSD